ncbi:DEAD/DEAH box helicase [Paenibacillus thalictri]|uniref:Nuclease n=1 Tax=Paenibacillus thalictri TaxID=2527873 RepID=A0A4Q9DS27_9BACL|nr:3'-5' exonuclease [Paenibacillus thalictri]TBL76544.1 nuclease [Paenibacillus thalictri]
MAYMIPETISRLASVGERVLFQTLKQYLPSDYMVLYKPEIDGRRPDFVIVGPDLGIVVLETNDYEKNALVHVDQHEWQVHTSNGVSVVENPLKEAKRSAQHVAEQVKKEDKLIVRSGKWAGQLKFEIGFGAVFTRMKTEAFIQGRLFEAINKELVLCRDEMDPEEDGFSTDRLIEKLHNMFTSWNHRWYILTNEDIRAIRYSFYPESRLSMTYKPAASYQDQYLLSRHNMTMDLRQDSIAQHLGDKHRLIRGVAGSGKTWVLARRTKILAKAHPDWNILVLCYSIPLARNLEQLIERMIGEPEDLLDLLEMINANGLRAGDQVKIRGFHQWLQNDLQTREEAIPALLGKLEKKQAILPTYDAILIDEGQEFEPEWLKLLSYVLNPATQSLLIVEDRAQSIQKRKNSLFQDIGLNFRGRSKILTVNYRNTAQIVRFAWDFYQRHSVLKHSVVQGSTKGVEIIPPQSTRRSGPEPMIKRFGSLHEEIAYIAAQIRFLRDERGIPYSDMLILYRVKDRYDVSYVDVIRRGLKAAGLPFGWLSAEDGETQLTEPTEDGIRISTINNVKGLDFQAVFIVNMESMPYPLEELEEREVSLLYIGMTRALEWLYLTYSGESKFTLYFEELARKRSSPIASETRMG